MDEPIECGIHSIIADCAVLAGDRTLLVRYADANAYDHQEGWFVPDDEVQHLEHPEASARRILREQLGLEVPDLRLSHVESFKGNNRTWHLVFHYVADVAEAPHLTPSPDVSAAEWFSLDDLPPASEVAHHGWALKILRSVAASRA
jgi:ADP-ribose pyrophosphatase YjhB (NUDIX family)